MNYFLMKLRFSTKLDQIKINQHQKSLRKKKQKGKKGYKTNKQVSKKETKTYSVTVNFLNMYF